MAVIDTSPPSGQLGLATPLGELLGRSDADMNAEFADYAELGVAWVRTDFWWDLVQSGGPNSYNWSELDRMVAAANKYNIKVVATLHGTPDWIDSSGGMRADANILAYANFAKAAAEHFAGKVQHWQIWNEPNLRLYWHVQPDASDYTKTLKAANTAIKGADPSAFVISGGLSPAPETAGDHVGAVAFLDQMYANGARGSFDAVGYHPYSWPLMPDDSAPWNGWEMMETGIRQTMIANGDANTPVWMTEMGGPTSGRTNAISQQRQADTIQQSYDLATGYSWAGPIMWYTYQDRGGSTSNAENWFGLVGPNGERKAAYAAYQNIALHDGPNTADPTPSPTAKVTFQQGVNGYAGTLDTMVREGTSDASYGNARIDGFSATSIDAADPSGTGQESQGLLQFTGLIGTGSGQIPHGARITKAGLTLHNSDAGDGAALHRMLADWSDGTTWNSLGTGIQANGTEAAAKADLVTGQQPGSGTSTFDVTSSVQAWASGAENHGWAFLPLGENGWDFRSSEGQAPRPLPLNTPPVQPQHQWC
ncbi:family 1 glycosylhydrolase [Microvirga aerilata]|uniref:family 1 glycosylhydrolase n=1 Tax=Microvirga aerilata TaxID=670292 RepID=UPI0036260680